MQDKIREVDEPIHRAREWRSGLENRKDEEDIPVAEDEACLLLRYGFGLNGRLCKDMVKARRKRT